ncbi:MAG: hypothetical protein ACJ8F7_20935 [Gemmataceae bacterium]
MTGRIPFVLALFAGITALAAGQTPVDPARGSSRFNNLGSQSQVSLPDLDRPIPGTLQHPHPYDITPDAGAWAICVTSYIGPTAGPLAFDLVSELRSSDKDKGYKLPAYLFNRTEELRKQERERVLTQRRQREEFFKQNGIPMPEQRYEKRVLHIDAQYAVLICDPSFKDIDTARKHLDHIRKLKPPSEKLMNKGQMYAGGEENRSGPVKPAAYGYLNPFQTAFVVPNPTLPPPKPAPSTEPAANLREFNKNEEYNIFKCPGAWTLVVKNYQGATTVVSRDSQRSVVEHNDPRQGDLLEACARQAHQLAEILRNKQLNFDSYVLHTKNMSIVTVGSFDSEKDPRMQQMMGQLSKLRLEPYETLLPPTPFKVPK